MRIMIAALLGIVGGMLIPWNIPAAYTPFVAMGLLAACNTLFGGIAAEVRHRFDARAFISGFFINTVLAALLTILGTRLGMNFSIAAIVYFGTRIFNNLAKIQHYILQKKPIGVKMEETDVNAGRIPEQTYQATSSDEDDDEE